MLVPPVPYSFAHVAPPASRRFCGGEFVLLLVTADHDTRKELLWARVVVGLQDDLYRACTLEPSRCFEELPAGQIVHFRPHHVVQVRLSAPMSTMPTGTASPGGALCA
ncbi:hypothetical protein [Deinococcus knuensis]|uniref:DUF2314 domain-containing protein n=1 Tax=Deinococcus knuensis TaxID=1837380 RepID=A0ABQ2SDR8_9DEIO|nr:hypothetical protein [Deinococcus knuensis]GGS15550.1 hypothetical protein GCM10008961_03710 [Deinococcus knuensis]